MREVKYVLYDDGYRFDVKRTNEYDFDYLCVDKITSSFINRVYNSNNYVLYWII